MEETTALLGKNAPSKQTSKKHYLGFLLLATVLLFVGSIAYEKKNVSSQADLSAFILDFEVTNDYGPLLSKSSFPWPHIAEPYRDSTITAVFNGANPTYTWTVYTPDSLVADGFDAIHAEASGSSFITQFLVAGMEYSVELTVEYDDDISGNRISVTRKTPVIVKYVRREMRDLFDSDFQRFLQALQIVMSTNITEGREMYGEKFSNYETVTIQHIGIESCTPFHGSDSFFTSHVAFNMEIEQAMQSIDPLVSLGYWDATSDSAEYGLDWKTDAYIFEYFGSMSPENDMHVVDDGYFAYSPVAMDASKPNHNAYGIITAISNNNPAQYVSRASSICGFPSEIPLAGCLEFNKCMASTSLNDLDSCIEGDLHANLHPTFGGAWECPVSALSMVQPFPELGTLMKKVTFASMGTWNGAVVNGYTLCPTDCSFEDDADECSCSAPVIDAYTEEELTMSVISGYMGDFSMSALADFYDSHTVDGETRYQFKTWDKVNDVYTDLSTELNFEFQKFLVRYNTHPGFAGNMADGNAPNDPVFWILHPIYEKMFWNFLVDPELTETFDFTFIDGSCSGSGEDDVLPLRNLVGTSDDDHYYTNGEMLTLAHPWNKELPYLYDRLDLASCSA